MPERFGQNFVENRERSPEQEERFFGTLSQTIGAKKEIITDEDLVEMTRGAAREADIEEPFARIEEERPFVFYRAIANTPDTQKLTDTEEFTVRPFSYSKPGTRHDVPLGYGGENPILIRIIDTAGEWEDTSKYWSGGATPWSEAFNLDKVVLRKVDDCTDRAENFYRQTGNKEAKDEQIIRQLTYIVDMAATERARAKQDLREFANDAGFWKEIKERAENLAPVREDDNENCRKVRAKYLELFRQTLDLPESAVTDPKAMARLHEAKNAIEQTQNKG